jgi:hypothetical protein
VVLDLAEKFQLRPPPAVEGQSLPACQDFPVLVASANKRDTLALLQSMPHHFNFWGVTDLICVKCNTILKLF